MPVKIRLMRIGAKRRPFYRVVAVDERRKRTGGYLELLGTYNPLTEPKEIKLKQDRIDAWIKDGAQLSDGFLRITGKAPQRPARKPKKAQPEKPTAAPTPEKSETPAEVETDSTSQAPLSDSDASTETPAPAESAETPETETPAETTEETPAESSEEAPAESAEEPTQADTAETAETPKEEE
jgi:small subunit ribosomal protein S16